jgi:heme oxygenase (mycobilin-producing)
MLVRTVRMTFRSEAVPSFVEMFKDTAPQIRAFEGCQHLELWEDLSTPHVLSTYSLWTGEAALEAYRQSDLFRRSWARARAWFAAAPVAHSHLILRAHP